ncbi:patatin-like phospholipase family protein [Bdellovibrio sp. KM01]|uniref:patatin-like phospholipase family protein n=1 Tax=Bdellovibrio sp. KM01 TaxID=2748865 RepID=UPI0015EA4D95|nr:patatin-like phospholipase family protein [Bdellovibrio sp. KM01]QLY24715.1 patatin-like phospholipase family protein [Bdellovibrio sp. KM01]
MRKFYVLGLMTLIFAVNSWSAESRRPKIGLVLGGGGARGIAHVGIIKVLEENRIPVDCIAGTSIGSLVGASYAVGATPEEMRKQISEANWGNMFLAKAPRQAYPFRRKQDDKLSMLGVEVGLADGGQLKLPLAAISTQEIEYFLRNLTYGGTVANFDSLPIPYRAIATDLATGEMVIMKDGDLVTALRASMAVPGIFPSVPSKGHILADGGLVRNLPVDVVRNMCADVVIAIDVGAAPLSQGEITGIFSVMDQYTRLMMIQNVRPQVAGLKDKDVFIAPQFDSLGSMDFEHSDKLIEVGRVAAMKALPSLRRYSVSEKEYSAWATNRISKKLKPKPIQKVTVADSGWVNAATLKDELKVPTGVNLNIDKFHDQLTQLYATGDFSQLDYELFDSGAGQDLLVLPVQKNWGPNYLNFGLSLGTDFESSYPWNLSAMYRRTWVNSLGAEWKSILQMGNSSMFYTEFYQPTTAGGNGFVAPYFRYYRIPLALWQEGDEVAKYKYSKISFGADVGVGSEIGEFRFGPAFNEYSASRNIGSSILPNSRTNDYGLRFNFFYDQLDNYFFPSTGAYLDLYGYYSIGASEDIDNYGLYGLNFRGAMTAGKGVFQFTLKGQTSTGDNGVLADVSWLGGFLNLSSYRYQELIGDQFAYGSVQYYRRMPFLSGSYWGAALETGRVFNYFDKKIADEWHMSGTGYLAYDSILGPMYLAAAYGDNKTWSCYFMLGKQF